jgi:guanylate kinase
VVVSGPSGCGKSSIIRRALTHPDLNIELSVSATTRKPRPGEQHGIDYFFMEREEFKAKRRKLEFLEKAEYNGNFYGTPASPVFDSLALNKTVLLEIEVIGALQVRDIAPNTLFIFIKTPTFKVLEERLMARGTESEQAVFQRLRLARKELAEAHWYDHQLINDDLDSCVDEFISILKSYGSGG